MLKSTNSPSKVAEIITQRFIDEIKTTGFLPWSKPWYSIHAQNIVSKKAYRGINVLMLALFGENGTDFLTFNQAKAAEGFIGSKGKGKGIPIVFYTKLPPKELLGVTYGAKPEDVQAEPDTTSAVETEAVPA